MESLSTHALALLAAVCATAAVPGAAARAATDDAATPPRAAPLVIAHRGGAMLRPENTLPAFRHAADLGVDVLEFDLMMTRDDRIAVHHDAAVNPDICRDDGGAAVPAVPVRSLALADLQRLDCGSRVRPQYDVATYEAVPGARVPELDEVLAAFAGGDAILFAETKMPRPPEDGTVVEPVDPVLFARQLEAAVRRHGLEDRLILQSFDFRTLDAMHAINPRIRTCLLGMRKHRDALMDVVRRHRAGCVVLHRDDVDAAGVAALREAGVLVYSEVVDDPVEWDAYVALGVDAIFTNEPAGLIRHLRAAGLRD